MPQTPQETRREYVDAFSRTMVDIWKEKLGLLKAVHSGALFRSVATAVPVVADPDVSNVLFRFEFHQYGHYLQRGVGREVPRGNSGDIGRAKVRRRKEWFQPKYQGSVHRAREFFAKSFSLEAINVISTTINPNPSTP